jgi:hypothetical protein
MIFRLNEQNKHDIRIIKIKLYNFDARLCEFDN